MFKYGLGSMEKMMVLKHKIRTLLALDRNSKRMLLEAIILTAAARLAISIIPFQKYKKFIGNYKEETPYVMDVKEFKVIKTVAWAVNTVCKYTPWESKCLVQALTAQRMLKKRQIGSTLYLGVKKDTESQMKAHAWLRCGQVFVTGGSNKNEFVEVAKFAV